MALTPTLVTWVGSYKQSEVGNPFIFSLVCMAAGQFPGFGFLNQGSSPGRVFKVELVFSWVGWKD